MQCTQLEDSTFVSFHLKIFGYHCNDVLIYIFILYAYGCILLARHKLATTEHQLHREALTFTDPNKRPMCKLICYNIIRTIVHIINVLFISSNNLGMLLMSIVGHAVGVFFVYKTQRPDHKHPIKSLLKALRNRENADPQTKQDIQELQKFFKDKTTF